MIILMPKIYRVTRKKSITISSSHAFFSTNFKFFVEKNNNKIILSYFIKNRVRE